MRTFTRFTLIALAALAAVGASSAQASADTLFVCAEAGSCQYGSIQSAVDAANAGDTIRVRAGAYNENVTIPAGKDGLVLRGAQAGVAGEVATGRPVDGQESALSGGANGTAIFVSSSGVTVDGFTIRDSGQGVWSQSTTSGLRVVNTVFSTNGNSVIPDTNGDRYTEIRHNAFVDSVPGRGASPGWAIVTGASRGRLLVAENRIAGPGWLVALLFSPARDVTVRANRAQSGSDGVAVLAGVDEAVVEDNVVDSTTATGLAWLTGTRNVSIRDNTVRGGGAKQGVLHTGDLGPSRDTVIEANDFAGPDLDAIVVPPGTVAGALVARYNRFGPATRGVVANGGVEVDARYNWWGCNEGPSASRCARLDRLGGANVTGEPWLTLSLATDSARITNAFGGTTRFHASLVRDSAGTVHRPARFPHVAFAVNAAPGASVRDFALLDGGLAGGTLVANGAQGIDLEATADNASVTRRVDFGPAPQQAAMTGPTGDSGTVAAPKPGAAAARSCKASARALSCRLTGKAARTSRGARVRAVLYRSGRRVAAGRVRVAGGRVRVRLGRRVAAGRYTLVLTRGGRRLARQTVIVRPA
jgi:hypothetical protein